MYFSWAHLVINPLNSLSRSRRLRVLASLAVLLSCAALTQAQKTVFAHYMVTNQDYQGDTDPTGEAKYSGGAGLRAMWMDAINVTHPEWVEICTSPN